MSHPPLPAPLRGIIPPLATPLLDRDRLDHAGLERLIEHVIAGGVHGIFLLGTTGEAQSLSYRLRFELVERACAQVAGRIPMLIGITDTSFVESVELAQHAEESGADAVVAAPPFYNPAGQPELARYFEQLASAVPLPLLLYNMPSHTKLNIDPSTVARLLNVPKIIGIKDSSAQAVYFSKIQRIAAARPEFALLMGPEELLASTVLLGGHGGVCGGANFAPRLYVDLYEAAARGDLEQSRILQNRVCQIVETIYAVGPHWSTYLQGLKCALACLGICGDALADPFEPFGPAERLRIEGYLRDQGLLTQSKAVPLGTE